MCVRAYVCMLIITYKIHTFYTSAVSTQTHEQALENAQSMIECYRRWSTADKSINIENASGCFVEDAIPPHISREPAGPEGALHSISMPSTAMTGMAYSIMWQGTLCRIGRMACIRPSPWGESCYMHHYRVNLVSNG